MMGKIQMKESAAFSARLDFSLHDWGKVGQGGGRGQALQLDF